MALKTSNRYGDIIVSNDAVARIIKKTVTECYGVTELVSHRLSDSVLALFNKESVSKGIKIETSGTNIFIDIYCIIAKTVSTEEVSRNLKSAILYSVETFTGMIVKSVNIHVMGMTI